MTSHDEPEQFGPYQVFERLGVGGMATVHRAKQQGIEGVQRVVALKRLLPHLADDAAFIKSFVREAKLALMLQHANIVQLFELGKVRNVYFIAMEYIDGRDVRQILRHARKVSGPPTVNVTLSLLIQACEALEYAHTRTDDNGQPLGLVHRDVSPSNLMVTRSGHLKVIDFGIAKAQIQQLATQTGKVKGKLAYMAPEATQGRELDARSDLFSIGIIAHELLTARPLFAAKTDYQTILNVQKAELHAPSAFNQAVPPELDTIVLRALARDPDQRYASAAELRDDLHEVRIRYQLAATNREVQAWLEWAFSLEAPGASFSGAAPSWSGLRTPMPSRTPLRASSADLATPVTRPSQPVVATAAAVKAEDEAAAIAWGGGECDDDVGGVSHPDVADYAAHAKTIAADPTRTTAPTPVAATVERGSGDYTSRSVSLTAGGSRKSDALKIGLGFAVAAVLAAIVVVGKDRLGGESKATQPREVVAEPGTLKFIVEPADATIKIAGLEPHPSSPWTVELEPGVIQIKISHPAFVSWETSVELSARETQTIRVVLSAASPAELAVATLQLNSDPPGLTVVLDGQPRPERTPASLTLEPGPHTVALTQDGAVVWTQDIVAEARTRYEFSPSMSDAKRREREARLAAERARLPGPVRPAPGSGAIAVAPVVTIDAGVAAAIPIDAPAAIAVVPGSGSGSVEVGSGSSGSAAVVPKPAIDAGATVTPGSGSGSAPRVIVPPPPPPPARSAVVVPPTAVRRISGDLSGIKFDERVGVDVPKQAQVKICIDTAGKVSSVTPFKLPPDVAKALQDAIKAWRYAPYLDGGAPTPACFVSSFGLK